MLKEAHLLFSSITIISIRKRLEMDIYFFFFIHWMYLYKVIEERMNRKESGKKYLFRSKNSSCWTRYIIDE